MSWWPSFSSSDKGKAPETPSSFVPEPSSASAPAPTENASAQDATSVLRNASFSRGSSPSSSPYSTPDELSASDVLAGGAFDVSKLHPMAQLGDSVDYLVLEDEKKNATPGSETALPSRGWSDDLCYGTGTTYLSGTLLSLPREFEVLTFDWNGVGLALGGAWGIREGGSRKLAVPSARLRLNSILNSVTRRGSFMGNSAGVLGTLPFTLLHVDTETDHLLSFSPAVQRDQLVH